ncbi:MAG: hypothetical protein HON90_12130, partial [Halobacteriovoraceae bacterium]|nr:hypothetical protein [Halobacteriovoraceae bacterium]
IVKINPKINIKNLNRDQIIKIPYEYLQHLDDVIFLKNSMIVPKNRKSNLCKRFERKKTKQKKIIRVKKHPKKIPIVVPKINFKKIFEVSRLSFKKSRKLGISSLEIRSNKELEQKKYFEIYLKFNKKVKVTGEPNIKIQAKGQLAYARFDRLIDHQTLKFNFYYQFDLSQVKFFRLYIPPEKDLFDVRSQSNDKQYIEETSFYEIRSVFVDEEVPRIVKIHYPKKGTFSIGDVIKVDLEFSEKFMITGKPKLHGRIDSGDILFNFKDIYNDNTLRFEYQVKVGDRSARGIQLLGKLELGKVEIRDYSGNQFVNNHPDIFTREVRIDRVSTRVFQVQYPAPKVYHLGEILRFTVNFNKNVSVIGKPYLKLEIGNNTRIVKLKKHNKNKLIFDYKVQSNEQDLDGIIVYPQVYTDDGVSIYDKFKIGAKLNFESRFKTGILINSGRVFITNLKPSFKKTFKEGDRLNVVVQFNENIHVAGDPQIQFEINQRNKFLKLKEKKKNKLIFEYIIEKEDHSKGVKIFSPIITSERSIKGDSGNFVNLEFSHLELDNYVFDTLEPYVKKIDYPENVKIGYDDKAQFLVYFNEKIQIKGTPRLKIDLASGEVFANYIDGDGTTVLRFEYRVNKVDFDSGSAKIISPMLLFNSTIHDFAMNPAKLNFKTKDLNLLKINGKVNYGLVRQNKGAFYTPESENVNSMQVSYAAKLLFGNTRIETVDIEDDADSILNSSLTTAINFYSFLKWSVKWQTEFSLGFKQINFEEASTFNINKLKNTYYQLGLKQHYAFNHALKFFAGIGYQQLPYIHAQGTKNLIIDPITVTSLGMGIDWGYYSYASLDLGLIIEAQILLEKSADNFKLGSGTSNIFRFYIDNTRPDSKIRFSAYYNTRKHDADLFTHDAQDKGIEFMYFFSLQDIVEFF